MKQGTWSVLAGCHSPVHSTLVLIAWYRLYYNWPQPWQIVCIYLHDIGHWGKDYLDNYEDKKLHGQLGANIAKRLFGQKGYNLIAGHNSYMGVERSILYEPDKLSWTFAPILWMVSNTIFEPKLIRKGCTRRESAVMFQEAMKKNKDSGFQEVGHEIYLKQWGHYNNLSSIKEGKK